MCFKKIFSAVVIVSSFNLSTIYAQWLNTAATSIPVNIPPSIHSNLNRENLTIFELVTLSQLQRHVGSSSGDTHSSGHYWISTPFLTNLLDSSQWNVQKAKRKILKAANWRKNNEIIKNQLPSQNLFNDFDLEIKGYDKEGCPVVIIPFGQWRTYRSYVEKVKSIPTADDNLMIYFHNVMERIISHIKNRKNSDCFQFSLIADMEYYDAIQTSGIAFFIKMIKHFDKVYPGMLKIAYLINCSPYFLKVAQTFKSAIPWDLRRKSFLYTENTYWEPAILENIDASQLDPKYGGEEPTFPWDNNPRRISEV